MNGYSPYLYIKRNNFTRNISYLEGNAIFIIGGQKNEYSLNEKKGLLQIEIADCLFSQNSGINVAYGGAVVINGRQHVVNHDGDSSDTAMSFGDDDTDEDEVAIKLPEHISYGRHE